MTWQGERRKQLPADWAARRQARLELDGYQCTHIDWVDFDGAPSDMPLQLKRCTARATDVHHALDADDHRIEALQSLCAWHHQRHTQAESAAARAAKPKQRRPAQRHPGLTEGTA